MKVRSKLTGVDRQLGDEVDVPSILHATLATKPNQAKPSQAKPDQGLERNGFDLPNGVVESASLGDASRSNFGHRSGCYLIGLLLMATAIAKLWMLLTDSFADVRVGISKEILWPSVAFEFWLAYENFRLRDIRVMSFINVVVFTVFAVFASVRWLLGYVSCGCSGSLELPAWIFIGLDLGIVTWLTASRSSRDRTTAGLRELGFRWQRYPPSARGRLAGLAIFASAIVVMQLSVAAPVRAMLFGDLKIQAIVKIDGDLIFGEAANCQVEIVNQSYRSAKIIGFSRSCRCFDLSEDPISKTIPANGRLVFPLVIKPTKLGQLHQRVELFLDHPNQFRVNVDVFGSVKGEER